MWMVQEMEIGGGCFYRLDVPVWRTESDRKQEQIGINSSEEEG